MSEEWVTTNRCAKPTDDLIIIDSDDEDEVIFVNEDGGQTLAGSEALVTPGFLESLPKNNESEVRSIFDNVVKIPAEPNSNPIVIERTFSVSPTDELDDEEQIELPSYNVQVLNKSDQDEAASKPPDLSDPVDSDSPSKPLIKLAPMSKLISQKAFVSLDQVVNDLGVSTPLTVRKIRKKRVEKDPLDVSKPSKVRSKNIFKTRTSAKALSPKSELTEKLEALQKYIPGSSSGIWPREQILRRAIHFIMELRKSDCELDIAEEALMQSNIKLTMDYERILSKVYSLCASEAEPSVSPARKTRQTKKEEAPSNEPETISENECVANVENRLSPVKNDCLTSTGEECLFLNGLLGEVRDSAKTHLLNFDPDIPFNDFLPPTLLNWECPKTKTDILDEIMFLENAISKCNSETEVIREVSRQQGVFKYEDLKATFKKEFDLDTRDDKRGEVSEVRKTKGSEIKKDQTEDIKPVINETNDVNETEDTKASVDIKNIKKCSPKKKKRHAWNKGVKGTRKRQSAKSRFKTSLSNDDSITIDSDENMDITQDMSRDRLNDSVEEQNVAEPSQVENKEPLENLEVKPIKIKVVKKRTKRKSNKIKRGKYAKKNVKESEADMCPDSELNTSSEVVAIKGENDESTKQSDEYRIQDDDDETPLDEIKAKLKMPVLKILYEKINKPAKVSTESDKSEDAKNEVKEELFSAPSKRRKNLRPKYVDGARTTRSLVKHYSAVMQEIDKEMQVFLHKGKADSDAQSSDDDDRFDGNLIIAEDDDPVIADTDKEPDASDKDLVSDKDVNSEKDVVSEKYISENIGDTEAPLKDPEAIQEQPVLDETSHLNVTVAKKPSPKKKKRYYTGRSKRKYNRGKNSKVKKLSFDPQEVNLDEPQTLTDDQPSGSNEKTRFEVSTSEPIVEPSAEEIPQPDEFCVSEETQGKDDETGSVQMISSCFSIDPSLFETLDGNNLSENERISSDDSPTKDRNASEEHLGSKRPLAIKQEWIENLSKSCTPGALSCPSPLTTREPDVLPPPLALASDEPDLLSSPLALTTDKPDVLPPPLALMTNEPDVLPPPLALTTDEPDVLPPPLALTTDGPDVLPPPLALKTDEPNVLPPPLTLKTDEHDVLPPPLTLKTDEHDVLSPPLTLKTDEHDVSSNKTVESTDAPLDFSLKSVSKTASDSTTVDNNYSFPLNLSNKTNDLTTSPGNAALDFSVKNKPSKSVPCKVAFNLSKSESSCLDGEESYSKNDKPITAFTSGKQIFTDPKDFNVPPVLNRTSVKSDLVSDGASPSEARTSTIKDNIISEITDILADLADETTPVPLNFNLDASKRSGSAQDEVSNLSVSNVTAASKTSSQEAYAGQVSGASDSPASPGLDQQSSKFGETQQVVSKYENYALTERQQVNSAGGFGSSNNDVQLPSQYPAAGTGGVQQMQGLESYTRGNIATSVNMSPNSQTHNYSQNSNLTLSVESHTVYSQSVADGCVSMRRSVYSGNQQTMSSGFHQQLMDSPQYDQAGNQIPYQPTNPNDPRFTKQPIQETISDSDKQLALLQPSLRDPRLARRMSDGQYPNSDAPFSGNLQINQLISEVINHNNFENFLMNAKNNQMIMNQNLDLDEDDLNLNRSDFDDFVDSDEGDDEGKRRQSLLRKSIDKLIVEDLKEPVKKDIAVKKDVPPKKDCESSDESVDESSFTSRVIRSPPMIKKNKSEDEDLDEEEKPSKKDKREAFKDPDGDGDRKALRRTRRNVKYTKDPSDESSDSSSDYEADEPSIIKKKSNAKERKRRNNNSEKRSKSDDYLKVRNKGQSSEDDCVIVSTIRTDKKAKKRVIDSDESQEDASDKYDLKVEEERSELSDEVSDHLKRVSDIKHRKLEGKEKRSTAPSVRRMKFLDELPDTDVNQELVPSHSKRHGDKCKLTSQKRDDSPKSTSRVVRKTITTERIVTKRIGSDSNSGKKSKSGPNKEKKVFVQERITLKVNERSNLDKKGGINFKCDALKEGEILKVVGGKLVRVRKRLSNSDEEIERERTKLQKCLSSLRIKKKSDKNAAIDDNPYSVLKEDKALDPDGKPSTPSSNVVTSPRVKRQYQELKSSPTSLEKIKNPVVARSSSVDSNDSDIKRSPIAPRLADPRRLNKGDVTNSSPGNVSVSPRISSSPNFGYLDNSSRNVDPLALVRRPSLEMARPDLSRVPSAERCRVPSPCSTNSQVALKECVSAPVAGVARKNVETLDYETALTRKPDMEVANKCDMEVARTSHVQYSFDQGVVAKTRCQEIVKRPEMEVARTCDYEISRGSTVDVRRRSETGTNRKDLDFSNRTEYNVSCQHNEIFTRRESVTTVESRRSTEACFSRREFCRETSVVSERPKKAPKERSILGMFQRGEINISNEGSWSQKANESKGGYCVPRRNEAPQMTRDNRNQFNEDNDSQREWREFNPYPPRDESGTAQGRNMNRPYRGQYDDNGQNFHPPRDDTRPFRNQDEDRPFPNNRPHPRTFRDDNQPFQNQNDQQYHQDDFRGNSNHNERPPFHYNQRERPNFDWQHEVRQQDRFRSNRFRDDQYRNSPPCRDNFRRSPDRYRQPYSDNSHVPPIMDRRMESSKPPSNFQPNRGGPPNQRPPYPNSRSTWN